MSEGDYTQRLSIKSWSEDDRPREKLMSKGKSVLSDAELLAILINSGTKRHSAVDIAKMILQKVNNDLNALGKFSMADFTTFEGIGEARAITIMSALELGRRRKEQATEAKPVIITSKEAYNFMRPYLLDLAHEEFWIIFLGRGGKVISVQQVSLGGISGTVADPRVIYKKALELPGCTGIILTHNHPSGNPRPSQEDIRLTKSMKAAGELLQILVLDHLIFCDEGYYSFADEATL
ncbi:MAG: RadC family protein [Imperialibacter sp.]|uniref:RadC family protein n=1 Tax=Imperialibacter sp. TaxID=2038411 RepID=UPI003A87BB77